MTLPRLTARVSVPASRLLLGAILALALVAPGVVHARTGYPKVLNYHLSNDLTDAEITELARWDAVVLDGDFPRVHPGGIARMRSQNPDILILAYVPINGTFLHGDQNEPESLIRKYWEGVNAGDFWLRCVDGSVASDWPGKGSTNLTPNSPVNAQGEQYWEWFARFVYEDVWQRGQAGWDGVFLDDVWDNVNWLNSILSSPIDSDRNGVADDGIQLDQWWRQGNDWCTQRIRQLLGPDVPLMGNGGNTLYAQLNGAMLENFPFSGRPDQDNPYGYAWRKWMFDSWASYFNGLTRYDANPAVLMVINTHWADVDGEPDRSGRYESHKRLCLGSTLLGDGYFSLDASWDDHKSLWWEPEYDLYLGAPLGPAYSEVNGSVTIWRRDYEAGMVIVNPNNISSPRTSDLPFVGPWDAYIGPPPDLDAPEAVTEIAAQPVAADSVLLTWTAVYDPGGSGVASRYDIRRATWEITAGPPWISAPVVEQNLVPLQAGKAETLGIGGLEPETAYWFVVRAIDAWENLAPLGTVVSATTPAEPPPPDTEPPERIGNLQVTAAGETWLELGFTAPADDRGAVAAYDLRYMPGETFDAAQWDAAMPATPPLPAEPGAEQDAVVDGLQPGDTYAFRIRSRDEAGNWSEVSDPAVAATLIPEPPPPPPDTIPPARVTDLAATVVDTFRVRLTWTAPGDDGTEGRAARYDLRWGIDTLEVSTWDEATVLALPGAPRSAGLAESLLVEGLPLDTTLAFALAAEDSAGNRSPLSNVACVRLHVPEPPDTQPPSAVDEISAIPEVSSVRLAWRPGAEPDLVCYRLYRGRPPTNRLRLYRDEIHENQVRDERVIPGRVYVYAVTAVDAHGNESAASRTVTVEVPLAPFGGRPQDFLEVGNPYPNPSSGEARIHLSTGSETDAALEVFDVRGRRVRLVVAAAMTAGDHLLRWDGADDCGRRVAPGIYFLRITAGGKRLVRKLHVVR